MSKTTIGFIGQGWIGKHYADDFESRGFSVVRYSLEEPYLANKKKIAECDIVFIAVPTPTREDGFDVRYVTGVLPLVGPGKTAVIKSTVIPGTTKKLQEEFKDIFVLTSPEFLREANAAYDASNPQRNIIGIPVDSQLFQEKAEAVLSVLPVAPYQSIVDSNTAELIKYGGNVFLAMKVVLANLLAEYASALDLEYMQVAEALGADPRIGPSHLQVVFPSGHTTNAGRGAGGHCFIKDMEAFRQQYKELVGESSGADLLRALVEKNNELLISSDKDLELLAEVYGNDYAVLS